MHICFSVCVCDPICLLGGLSAWGMWRIAFPVEEGARAAVWKQLWRGARFTDRRGPDVTGSVF